MTIDDDRDAATWEAASVLLHNQTQRLLNSLRAARRDGRIPQDVVGLGQILTVAARADMLRAVEASRWQREAKRLRRTVWVLAGVSGVSLLVSLASLVAVALCSTAAGP